MVILTNKISLPVKLVVSISKTEHPSGVPECQKSWLGVRNLFPLIGIGLRIISAKYLWGQILTSQTEQGRRNV